VSWNPKGWKHGHTGLVDGKVVMTPTYSSWNSMKIRCADKSRAAYGGKGIKVCERWLGRDGFQHFLEDMGERPEGCTLGRKKNHLGYSKSNCGWETKEQQYSNQTSNRNITVFGETLTLAEACRKYGKVNVNTARCRVRRGMNPEMAITTSAASYHRWTTEASLYQECRHRDVNYSTIVNRIKRGLTREQAFAAPGGCL